MTKQELERQVAKLDADNARLREQLLDLTNTIMEMVRLRANDQVAITEQRERWREQKRARRANVREMSGGQNADSPVDIPADSPRTEREGVLDGPLGVSPAPLPVTPLNPPKRERAGAPSDRPAKREFDEDKAREYARSKGFSDEHIDRMVAKFLAHHQAGGWKRTGGVVIRDQQQAWVTWVLTELDRNPPSGNGSANGSSPPAKKFTFVFPDGHEVTA